ncbi:probable transporter (major facilitator superfamily) [Ramularia collo-cygni]|uniref:Probable transporter (Major facilitator superfamily) n=1 Tax=Ramularia collo-cygni TaxID=112498 RepID=A0A2D3VBT2_9PEZI|nr:probable transporter (major facilitator superfamily) [Ramularia collo-cygni]CZT21156.1 probable transporter (major facilitator superfamily) [Ramularia collo-cygni]
MVGSKFYGLRGSKLNFAITFIAGMDFLLFGYDQGVMGGLLTLPSFVRVFPEIDTTKGTAGDSPTATKQGIAIASYNLGCFAGAVICIWLGEYLGRKKTIFLGSAIMVVGAAIQTSAFSLGQLIGGRIITGIGNGLNTSTVPTWQSETTKSHKRGQMVMIEGALITGGIMLSYWIDYGCSFLEPSTISWRLPIGLQIVFALIILAFILGLPESPRWLILKGREEEALTVLASLGDLEEDDEYIQNEFAAIKDTVLEMSKAGFADVFTMGKDRNFHRALLGYVNQMFQQISGINLITYYAATIYESIGLDGNLSRLLAAANGTEYFLASWIAVFLIEKAGRRVLMLFGAVGMSLSMVVLAIVTSFTVGDTQKVETGPGYVAVVFLFIFNTFFAVGWLGMTWLYPSEIVPLRIRAPSSALSTSANWIFNFMVVMVTPVAFATIGYQTYIIFAVINAFIVPCVYFFYPETAYRSLEEMDEIFHKSTGYLDVVQVAKPRNTPNRYDKYGNLLHSYLDTEVHRRHSSVAAAAGRPQPKAQSSHNEGLHVEKGFASGSGSDNEKNV